MSKKLFLLYTFLILSPFQQVYANSEDSKNARIDPYQGTVYHRAFNQSQIWEKYREVLEAEGLKDLFVAAENESNIVKQYAPEEFEPKSFFSSFKPVIKSIKSVASYFKRDRSYSIVDEDEEKKFSNQEVLDNLTIELNKNLVAHFLANKKGDAYQVIRNELISTTSYITITGLILTGGSYTLPANVIDMGTGFGAFVIANQVASAFYKSIKTYIQILNYSGDPLLPYELKYVIMKRHISPFLWEKIESRFAFARNNPYDQQKYLKFFDIIFKIPHRKESFLLSPPRDEVNLPDINDKLKYTFDNLVETIDELFHENYVDSENVKLELITSLWEHIMASADRFHIKRNLFFVGKPGVGKTRMVRQIEKKLRIPVLSLNLGIVSNSSDLFGSEEKPGALLEAITSCEITNPILLMDEATEIFNDSKFTSSLKTFLEPEEGRFESPYLKSYEIKIHDYFFFSLGNGRVNESHYANKKESKEEVEESQGALDSRLRTIEFPEFKKDFIKVKAYEIIPKILSNHIYFKNMNEPLYPNEQEKLDQIIHNSQTIRDLEKELPSWCMSVNIRRMRELKEFKDFSDNNK